MPAWIQLLKKDLWVFWKDRPVVVVTYLMPVLVIFLFGSIFGAGEGGTAGPSGIRLGIVDESGSPLVRELIDRLSESETVQVFTESQTKDGGIPLTEKKVRRMITENQLQFALVFPEDAVAERGIGIRVQYLHNPQNLIEEQMVEGVIQRTLFSETPKIYLEEIQSSMQGLFTRQEIEQFNSGIAETVSETFGIPVEDTREFLSENNPMDSLAANPGAGNAPGMTEQFNDLLAKVVDLRKEQLVGKEVNNPVGTRMIGGWAIMFLLFSLTGAASSLFDEKHSGIFFRLLSGPVSREDILFSKFMLMVLIGLSQLIICFLSGWFFFRIEIFSIFGSLALYSFIVALSCTSFGMLLSSVSKTSAQANAYATLFILPMSALGGAWWPISLMPDWIQVFSGFTLVYWAIEGYEQILWAQRGISGAILQVGILVSFTALALAFSAWRFRRGNLFA